jgi:cyanophycin synthetase
VRLVEIRLLEGPNLYALVPTVKIEIEAGRGGRWAGQRSPARGGAPRLAAVTSRRDQPAEAVAVAAWLRRLRATVGEQGGPARVHRGSDPGRWIVAWPWTGAERARIVAEAAVDLAMRRVPAGRTATLSSAQRRVVERWATSARGAPATAPGWIRDVDRRLPAVSVSGTNGKSTVARLVTHILVAAGRHVGSTTSDGVYVDERLVDAGDWTGPGGAAQVLGRSGLDAAVLETARGGILLRGVGYESNDVSVLTNVSSDHLDLQGIHTLPQLAEVKAVICRITRPAGRVVLNADDALVRAVGRRVAAPVALFTLGPGVAGPVARHISRGGIAYAVRGGIIVELAGTDERPVVPVTDVPIAIGGLAGYNVANALAAAAAARGLGLDVGAVAHGLRDFRPTAALSPGRLNLFRLGRTTVIVDFAHNEAGVEAVLAVANGLAAAGSGRVAPITAIVGTAGDRPDDTLRGIGRIAAERTQRVAIKETIRYLRGRPRRAVVGRLLEGIAAGGMDPSAVPVYETETAALRGELGDPDGRAAGRRTRRILVLLCHEEREAVLRLLDELGARPVDVVAELHSLVPASPASAGIDGRAARPSGPGAKAAPAATRGSARATV